MLSKFIIFIKKMNSNIESYLNTYINDRNVDSAVLINGSWGIGKTFFIKELIKKWSISKLDSGNFIELKPIYVSLNGLQTIEEVTFKIKEILHPLFYSKGANFIRSIGNSFLKTALKINIDQLELEIEFDELTLFKNKNSKIKGDKILVFDDLERTKIPLDEILGFINNLTEHSECHVIIIADESKININKEYKVFKEKTISKTLLFKSEVNKILENYFSSLDKNLFSNFLKENRSIIEEIYLLSESNNLRLLKRALKSYEFIFNQIDFKENEKLKFFLLIYIISYYLEFNLGNDNINYYDYFLSIDYLYDQGYNSPEDKTKIIRHKYKSILIDPLYIIDNFIEFRKPIFYYIKDFNYQDLINICNLELNSKVKFTPTHPKLECFHQCSDRELQTLIDELILDFFESQYYNKLKTKDIIESCFYLLAFVKNELYITKNESEIITQYKFLLSLKINEKDIKENTELNKDIFRPIKYFYDQNSSDKTKIFSDIDQIILNKKVNIDNLFFDKFINLVNDDDIMDACELFEESDKYKFTLSNLDYQRLAINILELKENISIDYINNLFQSQHKFPKMNVDQEIIRINFLLDLINNHLKSLPREKSLRGYNFKALLHTLNTKVDNFNSSSTTS